MSTISLVWVGDLDHDKHRLASYPNISDERFRPKKITMNQSQKEIKIGRINSKNPPDYPIESCINNRMISRNHATIERLSKGGFMLYDHSMNGTYVNYTRVTGGVSLKSGDVICFGHLNGANLKPGESVSPFFSDLKYRVDIGATSDVKRKRRPSGHGSVMSSNQSDDSDLSDGSEISGKKKGSPKKSKKYDSDEDTKSRKSMNGSRIGGSKKSLTSSRKSISGTVTKQPKTERKMMGKSGDPENAGTEDTEKCAADHCHQPKGLAVDWIQCDKCENWYHQYCVRCTKQEAQQDIYHCFRCKKRANDSGSKPMQFG